MTATPYADQNGAWLNAENASTYLQEALQSALLDLDNAKNNLENIYPYYEIKYHFVAHRLVAWTCRVPKHESTKGPPSL